jgi:hypothetical protein
MRAFVAAASVLVCVGAGVVSTADPLPMRMTGKWDGDLTNGRPVYWTWTVTVTKRHPTARSTRSFVGVALKARRAPRLVHKHMNPSVSCARTSSLSAAARNGAITSA